MTAFAANSVLNRLAVGNGTVDPLTFAVIRVLSGAVMLTVLTLAQKKTLPLWTARRFVGAGALALYMVGFSAAYLTLDTGAGALILFGVVQMTMLALAAASGVQTTRRQFAGAAIAFVGLAWVLWPTPDWQINGAGALVMGAAGFGWAIYTIAGRSEPDALAGTAANFCFAVPVTALAAFALGGPFQIDAIGGGAAVLSGAVTSGLGYAVWYRIVGQLDPSVAATVQLTVPLIALAGGVMFLGETATLRFLGGTIVVLGGIILSAPRPNPR